MKARQLLLLAAYGILFASCGENGYREMKSETAADSISYTGAEGNDIKLVKTASINFKVKDVTQSSKEVSAIAKQLGGMIFHQSLQTTENEKKELPVSDDSTLIIATIISRSDITARVPVENLETFLYSVSDLGYFVANSTMNIDDKSLQFLQNSLLQKVRNESLAKTKLLHNNVGSTSKAISIKDDVINQKIQNMQIDADARYSVVNLSLFQNPAVRKEVVSNVDLQAYTLPFSSRIENALNAGWQFFLSFLVVLTYLWMFLVAGVVVYFGYNFLRQKRKAVA
jgi:hypothetical protein